jgi:hypothetical protein
LSFDNFVGGLQKNRHLLIAYNTTGYQGNPAKAAYNFCRNIPVFPSFPHFQRDLSLPLHYSKLNVLMHFWHISCSNYIIKDNLSIEHNGHEEQTVKQTISSFFPLLLLAGGSEMASRHLLRIVMEGGVILRNAVPEIGAGGKVHHGHKESSEKRIVLANIESRRLIRKSGTAPLVRRH